jgi:hypothetical protein
VLRQAGVRELRAFLAPVEPGEVVQPCRLTIALIQIGAKGEVQPLEMG